MNFMDIDRFHIGARPVIGKEIPNRHRNPYEDESVLLRRKSWRPKSMVIVHMGLRT
jgi:hypothetical protein